MAGMGPAPKPAGQRRRRNATIALTQLPMEGRRGRAPVWPLIPDVVMTTRRDLAEGKVELLQEQVQELLDAGKPVGAAERRLDAAIEKHAILQAQLDAQRAMEAKLWRDLWKLPQAVQWERLAWYRDVAQYVRHKVLAELGELASAKEARQWSDRLGLSPLAMLRLRWEVIEDETARARRERDERDRQAASTPAAGRPDPYAALRAV